MLVSSALRHLAIAFTILVIGSQTLSSQEFRATLTGLVTDPSGAVVPNASVSAINQDTAQKYSASTTSTGSYFIPYMLPGIYKVSAASAGFETKVQDQVVLQAGKSFGLNFALTVGASSQVVEVSATPPLVETANASGGTIINNRDLANLPLNGRQVYTLLGTTPGSQFAQTQFGAAGYSGTHDRRCQLQQHGPERGDLSDL